MIPGVHLVLHLHLSRPSSYQNKTSLLDIWTVMCTRVWRNWWSLVGVDVCQTITLFFLCHSCMISLDVEAYHVVNRSILVWLMFREILLSFPHLKTQNSHSEALWFTAFMTSFYIQRNKYHFKLTAESIFKTTQNVFLGGQIESYRCMDNLCEA